MRLRVYTSMTYQFSKLMVEINGLVDFTHCTRTTQHAPVNHYLTHYSLQIVLLIIMPHVRSQQDLPDIQTNSYNASSTFLWCVSPLQVFLYHNE